MAGETTPRSSHQPLVIHEHSLTYLERSLCGDQPFKCVSQCAEETHHLEPVKKVCLAECLEKVEQVLVDISFSDVRSPMATRVLEMGRDVFRDTLMQVRHVDVQSRRIADAADITAET